MTFAQWLRRLLHIEQRPSSKSQETQRLIHSLTVLRDQIKDRHD